MLTLSLEPNITAVDVRVFSTKVNVVLDPQNKCVCGYLWQRTNSTEDSTLYPIPLFNATQSTLQLLHKLITA
jgi:hypothetical protein